LKVFRLEPTLHFTIHVDDGEWSALAKPGSHVSGAEIIDGVIKQGHTQGLGSLPQKRLENVDDPGEMARICERSSRLAGASLRKLFTGNGGRNCFLATEAEELSEQALPPSS
jgi:hypothetical protein